MKMNKTLNKRGEADPTYTWKTNHLFMVDEDWEQEYGILTTEIPSLGRWKDQLAKGVDTLYECLEAVDRISMRVEKIYVYANLRFHEDSGNSFYQAMADRSSLLSQKLATDTSYIVPEILEIDETTLLSFMTALNGMKKYSHFIENILRQKEHTLTDREETVLAKSSEMADSAHQIFVMINDADLHFPKIKDESGELVELTKGRYTAFLESRVRQVRKDAFQMLYQSYLKQKNTLAATYYASVKKDIFYAEVRKYPSALAAALDDDNIPFVVYDKLIDTVHENLHLLHRYVAMRKKALGLDELHMYDLYTPLALDVEWEIPYLKAQETVLEALKPLGPDYIKKLEQGFSGGWIDVYENEGKRGGAYSWGSYPGHPYVLLNHNDTINSMFTLAHEMGHALHSAYTWENQPYTYGGHKIFVAEVASTVNEALLMEHLLNKTQNKKDRAYLINYFMEQFRGTLFRQTMFAEFERKTHGLAEEGQPLTVDVLMGIYRELNKLYFGEDIVIDDEIAIEWARIPHFYNAFYVYQYATGYSAAITLSRLILERKEDAVEKYISFLKKGDSEYSIDLLKGAGVDMSKTEPIEMAMRVFEGLLDEMDKLL